ncbi:MAG TPA: 50S rRNA methyltransferase [Pseudomonas sp.]|nr:50S rRNA methyltransferase [Pseudomonas sp.]MBB51085.1 50S rRNA methyltransferase [Pseudomonadales bacterium]HCA24029.1 50S rRNA methyltransferase [Pseudomonas sp.]|tara:strand:+ start:571 stop:1695 length:1125 start_codon:yes stop_codon:yes gene_type:complete
MLSCTTPYGTLQLQRYPASRDTALQAFDTADLYLLQRLQQEPESDQPLLVINDSFGTLACALAAAGKTVHSWGDSWMSWRALQSNLAANGLGSNAVQFFNSTETPTGHYQQVLLRIPKSLSLLQDQLQRLRPLLTEQALLLAGSMIKHLPPSAGDLLATHIGPYQASLGWKKARLLQCQYDPALQPHSRDLASHYPLEGTNLLLSNRPGVFSHEKLDIGTRVLLPCIAADLGSARVVDLGCGNGALGLMAALRNPDAQITFIDESWAAVASARDNFAAAFPARSARFIVSDGLSEAAANSADLILCNPPFHQQQVVGDQIARRLFRQSRHALAPGAALLVVGNRHLGYHQTLKRDFKHVEQLAAAPKFVVLAAS